MELAWPLAPPDAGPVPGEVLVLAAPLDRSVDPAHEASLSPDERERAARFRFERDRRRFVTARGHLRQLLGRYLGREPAAVRFAYGPHGKPLLDGPELRFNVSHSGELALLAFALGRELGVDVEQHRAMDDLVRIARRYFSAPEVATLQALPEPEKAPAFFRCWARKEAFLKLTGEGLGLPLGEVEVTLAPGDTPRIKAVPRPFEPAGRWWLEGLDPAPGFSAALVSDGRPTRVACGRLS